MSFGYFYGDQSESYSFYRFPKQLMTGEQFKRLSMDAKVLYGLMLDRMGLSAKNGWRDELGRVFIYFSIVYLDALRHQWLFYADYIVMKKDGTIWVIETKGGESKGKDKNIDPQIENKFNAFKAYAAKHGLCWGFVRDKDNRLYINNTEFVLDMADDHWQPIAKVF